jgi:hypothetical protein
MYRCDARMFTPRRNAMNNDGAMLKRIAFVCVFVCVCYVLLAIGG